MIDYNYLVECMKSPAKLTEDNHASTCRMMLKAFVTNAEWNQLRSKLPSSFGDDTNKTKELYRFGMMLEVPDKTLQAILCAGGLSSTGSFYIYKEISSYFTEFIKNCKDIDALSNLLNFLNKGSDYELKSYKEYCRSRIQFLQEQSSKLN